MLTTRMMVSVVSQRLTKPSSLLLTRLNSSSSSSSSSSSLSSSNFEEARDPKDRSRVIPWELSSKYLDSSSYYETYGKSLVWQLYVRNFSKGRKWRDTRKTCIRQERITTATPCPICRDEYLVVDYRNVKLINQFINKYNGQILPSKMTGVCQKQHMNLRVAITKAMDHGYLDVDPPFVEYDYDKYLQQS